VFYFEFFPSLDVHSETPEYHNDTPSVSFWRETTPSSWDTARLTCKAKGGDLAIIDTPEKMQFILDSYAALDGNLR
jgi:hypothetical protein